jgi:methylenetetrahydrofolate reductase (NADPH)
VLVRTTFSRSPAVAEALRSARYELLPTAKAEELVLAAVPTTVTLTVTASANKGLAATLDLTERLIGHGYSVVPHLAARMVAGRTELAEIVDRLCGLGVTNVFCPAGDADPPAGDYSDALSLLQDLTHLGRPFPQIGITGYPESHPAIDDDVTIVAMWDKRLHATYIVSNLCFDPKAVKSWLVRLRRRGVDLPVLVGLPGPVEPAKLLSMASRIGVGQSVKFLRTHKSTVARMAAPGGFSPERFLQKSADYLADPALHVTGLHLFTFNQLAETEQWRQALLAH